MEWIWTQDDTRTWYSLQTDPSVQIERLKSAPDKPTYNHPKWYTLTIAGRFIGAWRLIYHAKREASYRLDRSPRPEPWLSANGVILSREPQPKRRPNRQIARWARRDRFDSVRPELPIKSPVQPVHQVIRTIPPPVPGSLALSFFR